MYFLKQPRILLNLILMAYLWTAASVTYFLVGYLLKYLPGGIFLNTYSSSGSELVAYIVGGLAYKYLGLKRSFVFAFTISALGGLLIMFWGYKDTSLMPYFIIPAKFGVSAAFCLVYVANVDVFPTLFAATAFGICNFFARGASTLSSELAERSPPLPMIVFTILCGLGMIVPFFIRVPKMRHYQVDSKDL